MSLFILILSPAKLGFSAFSCQLMKKEAMKIAKVEAKYNETIPLV